MQRWVGMKQEPQRETVDSENFKEVIGERTILLLSTFGFVLSIVFLSQNITGSVVSNFSTNGANWFGGILFVLAIMGFLYYIWKRKRLQRRKK